VDIFDLPDDTCRGIEADGDLERLAVSLCRDGLLQAVILQARGEKFKVVDGRRRVAAARLNALPAIRATVYAEGVDEQTIRRREAVANLERRDLNPVEEALAVVRLLEAHTGRQADTWTDVDAGAVAWAAAALGRSEAWIRTRAYLTRLCPKVRAMVADGRLPLAQAREICKLASAREQTTVAGFSVNEWNGHTTIASVNRVRRSVAERLSTLRGVPWETGPGAPGFAGRLSCEGCPDNSAYSMLFAADAEDAAPEARCLNAVCYRAKMKVAEKAVEDTVKRLKGQKGVAPTVGGVRAAGSDGPPEYVNAGTVARRLDAARGGGGKKSKAAAGGGAKFVPYQDRPETKLQEARAEWKNAVDRDVMKKCVADPLLAARLTLVTVTKTWKRHVLWGDTASKAIRAKIDPLLAKVVSSSGAVALAEIVADIDPEKTDTGLPFWALRHVAGLLDINLPAKPKIEDFEKKIPSLEPRATSDGKKAASPGAPGRGKGGKKGGGKKTGPVNTPIEDACDLDCETCSVDDCEKRGN
jgi:hypothetical protein